MWFLLVHSALDRRPYLVQKSLCQGKKTFEVQYSAVSIAAELNFNPCRRT